MHLKQRLFAFVELGQFLSDHLNNRGFESDHASLHQEFDALMQQIPYRNPWFTPVNLHKSIAGITAMLQEQALDAWLKQYNIPDVIKEPCQIGVVMAGNIPMVGFHDLLCVLLSGHQLRAKLSTDDNLLLPFMAKVLDRFMPGFAERVSFESNTIKGAHAYIATGSDNSSRYFEHYFGAYPNIIRRNRTSIAVMDGTETADELEGLADDVFSYFGMGCRNVTQILIPKDYPISRLFDAFAKYNHLADHHKYINNYDYRKSVALLNKTAHYDNGFLLMFENDALFSPIAAINYVYYANTGYIKSLIESKLDKIQCVTGHGYIPFGKAQMPDVSDYADGIDTMQFLLSLNRS